MPFARQSWMTARLVQVNFRANSNAHVPRGVVFLPVTGGTILLVPKNIRDQLRVDFLLRVPVVLVVIKHPQNRTHGATLRVPITLPLLLIGL